MEFGVGIPTTREGMFYPIPFAGISEIVKLTQLAERLGYHSVWGTEFINPTTAMNLPDGKDPNWYEPLISLSYLAGVTEHIKLVSGVTLLPYRDPVILAKQVATLDQVSNGRFLFGWGLGRRDEFVSINTKLKSAHRGRMQEEHMDAIHMLLNQEGKVSFVGEYYEFHDVNLNPKPLQKPLPVYIAGHTERTPARIAKWATGISVAINSIAAEGSTLHSRMEWLREGLAKEGADISKFDVEISIQQLLGRTHEETVERFKNSYLGRRLAGQIDGVIANSIVGTPEEVVEKVKSMEEEGITLCMSTNIAVDTFEEMLEQVQWLSEEVMPHFK